MKLLRTVNTLNQMAIAERVAKSGWTQKNASIHSHEAPNMPHAFIGATTTMAPNQPMVKTNTILTLNNTTGLWEVPAVGAFADGTKGIGVTNAGYIDTTTYPDQDQISIMRNVDHVKYWLAIDSTGGFDRTNPTTYFPAANVLWLKFKMNQKAAGVFVAGRTQAIDLTAPNPEADFQVVEYVPELGLVSAMLVR